MLPGVRSAVESYVRLARDEPWPVAVASSLTELFAPDLMAERIRAFERYYPWVPDWGLDYFRARLVQARVDSDEGLELTLSRCTTRALQERAVAALERKCRILWSMLDAIMAAYGAGPAEGSSPQSTTVRPQAREEGRREPGRRSPPPTRPPGPSWPRGCASNQTDTAAGRCCSTPRGSCGSTRRAPVSSASATGAAASMRSLAVLAEDLRRPGTRTFVADVLEFLNLSHGDEFIRFSPGGRRDRTDASGAPTDRPARAARGADPPLPAGLSVLLQSHAIRPRRGGALRRRVAAGLRGGRRSSACSTSSSPGASRSSAPTWPSWSPPPVAAGLYTNLITSGLGLTPRRAEGLKGAGLDSVQISLQADEQGLADRIAGVPAHAAKLRAARLVRELGLPLTINVVIHRHNIDRVESIIQLAESLGAHRLELANVQFYGWAFRNRDGLLPHRRPDRAGRVDRRGGRRPAEGEDDDPLCPARLLRRPPQGLHGRLGSPLPDRRPGRRRTPLPDGAGDPGPAVR